MTSTEWHIYGLYGIWSTLPVFVSTSTESGGDGGADWINRIDSPVMHITNPFMRV